MKKLVQLSFIVALLFASINVTAQVCLPDPIYTSPGIYPDSTIGWTQANVGVLYSQVITAIVPDDTTVTIFGSQQPVTIDSIVLVKIGKLPSWLSVQCEPPSCGIPGGETGCGILTGTPPAGSAGTYELDLITTTYVKIVNLNNMPYNQTDTVSNYFKLVVNGPSNITPITKDPFNFNIIPNPNSGNFKLNVQMPNSQEATVTILNIIGQAVYNQNFSFRRGTNDILVDNLNIPEGNYFVTIKSGNHIQTKKLYINR